MENKTKEEMKTCDCCSKGCECGDCEGCKKAECCTTGCCDSSKACCSSGGSSYRRWAKWLLWLLAVLALVKFLVGGAHGGMGGYMKGTCGCGGEMMSGSAVSGQMNCMGTKHMKGGEKGWFNRGKGKNKYDTMISGAMMSGNLQ